MNKCWAYIALLFMRTLWRTAWQGRVNLGILLLLSYIGTFCPVISLSDHITSGQLLGLLTQLMHSNIDSSPHRAPFHDLVACYSFAPNNCSPCYFQYSYPYVNTWTPGVKNAVIQQASVPQLNWWKTIFHPACGKRMWFQLHGKLCRLLGLDF